MVVISKLISDAKKIQARIVFPESEDERILKAVSKLAKEKIAKPIILGDKQKIMQKAKSLKISLKEVQIIKPDNSYNQKLYNLRKNKGVTLEKAEQLLKDKNYYGCMMVQENNADGMIAGATRPTADTLRPALQILKSNSLASSYFLMIHKDRTMLFADSAFVIEPDSKQLAEIAISTADSAKYYHLKPKVAMLSFSTKGSAKHPEIDKVIKATKIVKRKKPLIIIDGELQVDAALIPEIAKLKCPNSVIKGDANVLIFPNLACGNIAYKLVERLGEAKAIGPIVQGLKKPINDLSRGCSVEDIITLTAITVLETKR